MTERLSHELACLLVEGDGSSDWPGSLALLRARLACDIAEGLESGLHDDIVKVDCTQLAAFLEGCLSSAEREVVVSRLADDAVARADVASAAALLEGIAEQPVVLPAGLGARAVGLLMGVVPSALPFPPSIAVASPSAAAWGRRFGVWPSLALVAAIVVFAPAVVRMVSDWDPPSPRGDATHPDVTPRNDISVPPADRSCDYQSNPAKTALQPGEQVKRSGKKPKVAAKTDDPCSSDQTDRDKAESAPPNPQ